VRVKAVEFKPISPSLNADIIHPDTNSKVGSTTELLLENPSFSTTDIRLTGERQTVSLLGSFSRHSLVLLDGVVLNPAGEAFDFSQIPFGQISYIEIIKGNSSVYGGSAAIGGIIHIHSKNAVYKPALEAKISGSTGSFGLYKQVYSASFSRKYMSVNTEFSHQTARNNFSYNTPSFWNAEPELDRLHNRKTADSFYLKSSLFSQASQIDYSLNTGSFVRQLPGPINFLDLYNSSRLTGTFTQHNLRGTNAFQNLSNEVLLWWNNDQSTYTNLDSTNPFGANHYHQKQQNRGLKAGSNLAYENTKLGWNAEYSNIDYCFNNYLNNNTTTGKRDNTALSLTAQHSLYPYFLEYKVLTAARGDYSKDELHPTWRIENELRLPYAEKLVLGGYVGTAFSQPSLFDMYWIGDSETQGNPLLESENSLGYNLYTELNYNRFKLKLAYYRNWVKNMIQWRQYYLNGVSWKPFNVGSADLQNYEVETQCQIHKYIGLSGSITFTHALDMSKNPDGSPSPTYNKKLVYTPNLKSVAKLNFGNEKCGFTLAYSYSGKQYSTADNLIEPLSAFDNLDASLFRVQPLPFCDVRIELKANNILNKRYDIYANIPQPGFNWFGGISISTKSFSSGINQ
jgi:outer membrane cobalamin receptor